MKKTKKLLVSIITSAILLLTTAGQAVFADTDSNLTNNTSEIITENLTEPTYGFCSNGYVGSHEQLANQSLKILEHDKGTKAAKFYSQYKDVLLTYCDKPDSDEKNYVFAYHFYDPYTKKNYLPSFLPASKITGMVKFHEHINKAINSYKSDVRLSMEELGRAIHFLEDINVPHHASNNVAGISSHSQYEKYVNNNNSLFFITTSKAYNKYSNLNFSDYCTSIFDECAKNAYSYKSVAKSYNTSDFEKAAKPTIKLCQENIASLLYRFEKEVYK